jgi:hypothetical protein
VHQRRREIERPNAFCPAIVDGSTSLFAKLTMRPQKAHKTDMTTQAHVNLSEAMGLRYIVWHSASERPPAQQIPYRSYLVWLHYRSGLISQGIPQVIRYSLELQDWVVEDFGRGRGVENLVVAFWAEIPRPAEAGVNTLEQPL